MSLLIAFGSQTGNAQNLAHLIATHLEDRVDVRVIDMGESDPEILKEENSLLVVTSTYGDGEAPDNASEWLSFLKFQDELDLSHLRFGVIALGDSYYPHFCQCGKDFDFHLTRHGAKSLLSRLDCDRYYEEVYQDWLNDFMKGLET